MWTQRDQIQAYQFLRRRLVSALVAADANHPTSPSRRLVLGTVLGLAATLLTAAAFGVIGLLNPAGAATWRQGGQVILEQETGARYVLGQDGLLHPVLNYASARLLAGGNGDTTVTVPAKALVGASRGAMLGIPGAPDSLPPAGRLAGAAMASCSRTSPDRPLAAEPISTVLLGGIANVGGRVLPAAGGLLVKLRTGEMFLLTTGHRFRLPNQAALAALGYEGFAAVPVSANWLNTVPAGRDLGLITVPGSGATGPPVAGAATRVGQVLGDGSFYLVRADGLQQISQTEADLMLGNRDNAAAYPDGRPRVLPVSVAAVDGAARSATTSAPPTGAAPGADYPRTVPTIVAESVSAVLCAVGDGRDDANLVVEPSLPLPVGAQAIPVSQRTDGRVADEVYVLPGSGALLREQVGAGTPTGTEYLVTDTGTKYPVPGTDAAKALGYGGISPHGVSGTLLALLPTGPALDPAAARQSVLPPR